MNVLSRFKRSFKNSLHVMQAVKANFQEEFPYRNLKLIGVTGTNGKTTTTQMIYHILKENGLKTGYLSTISAKIGDQEIDTGFHVTTPDPWMVPKFLHKMVDAGIEYAVIEATSQGLEQNRLWGLKFEAAAITNIQSDHLDYHKTWENYASAKFKIIKKLKPDGIAVLYNYSPATTDWLKIKLGKEVPAAQKVVWCDKAEMKNIKSSFKGFEFELDGVHFQLPLLGEYNLENAMCAIRVCQKYLPLEKISKALATFPTPVGRMEVIQHKPFVTIVDFAHTPDALSAALNTLIHLKAPESKIICVFGCAGKRDVDRRKMGAVSAELADVTILTAEDPRDEKLVDINIEIMNHARNKKGNLISSFPDRNYWIRANIPGIKNDIAETLKEGNKPVIMFNEDSIRSREDAIECAITIADPGDIVFITGKAHEASLCFGETEYPWSDHETARKFLVKGKH